MRSVAAKTTVILLFVLLLSGCLDVVHHVGGSGEELHARYRITLAVRGEAVPVCHVALQRFRVPFLR